MKNSNINLAAETKSTVKYSSLNISIGGLKLPDGDILDLQINYDDIIKGYLSFVDKLNITEFAPITGNTISINFIDSMRGETSLEFIITKADVLRIKNNQINVEIEMMEVNSYFLNLTYYSGSYSSMKFLDILSDIFSKNNIKINLLNVKDDIEVLDFFVTPANITLLEFLRQYLYRNNFRMYSDRYGLSIIPKESLNFSTLVETGDSIFTLDRKDHLDFWNIIEYKASASNMGNTIRAANANKSVSDVTSLKYQPTNINIEKYYPLQKINGGFGFGDSTIVDVVKSSGTKEISHICGSTIEGDDEDYRDIINSQQIVKIVIQGLSMNRMFGKVSIGLPRAVSVQTGEYDEVFSSSFIVTKIVDKFYGGHFVQFLTLQSPDYGKGSDSF